MGIFILCIIALTLYFLPAIVAYNRKKNNANSIFILNLFMGWSGIGWVIALVWAVAEDKK